MGLVYWIILEISLILFLPFIMNNNFGYEIRIKYFLIQIIGSFFIIYIFIFCLKYIYFFISILFFLGLLKLIPFLIISLLYIKFRNLIFFVFINCLVGCLGGLGSLCLRKLIVYSSLRHNGWIIRCLKDVTFT